VHGWLSSRARRNWPPEWRLLADAIRDDILARGVSERGVFR